MGQYSSCMTSNTHPGLADVLNIWPVRPDPTTAERNAL